MYLQLIRAGCFSIGVGGRLHPTLPLFLTKQLSVAYSFQSPLALPPGFRLTSKPLSLSHLPFLPILHSFTSPEVFFRGDNPLHAHKSF